MNVKKIFACALAMIAMSLQVISGNPEPAPEPKPAPGYASYK